MKYMFIILTLSVLVSCGKDKVTIEGTKGADGKSCYVAEIPTGAIIKCDDGSAAEIVNKTGTNGVDGTGCVAIKSNQKITITCGDTVVSFDVGNNDNEDDNDDSSDEDD